MRPPELLPTGNPGSRRFQRRAAGLAALLGLLLPACGEEVPIYKSVALPSGQTLKLRASQQVHLGDGRRAWLVKYETDLDLRNRDSLLEEIDRIWDFFRPQVEQMRIRTALIRATTVRQLGWEISGEESQVVFRRTPGGWDRQEDPVLSVREKIAS